MCGPTLYFLRTIQNPALKAVINAFKDFSMATISLAFPNFQVLYFATLTVLSIKKMCVVSYIFNAGFESWPKSLNVYISFDFKDC